MEGCRPPKYFCTPPVHSANVFCLIIKISPHLAGATSSPLPPPTCQPMPLTAKHLPDIFSPPLKNMKVPLHKHTLLKNLLLLHKFSLGLNAPRKVCGSDLLSYDISYMIVKIGQSFLFLLPGCQGHG